MLYHHRYRDWVLVITLVLMAVLVFVVPQDVRAQKAEHVLVLFTRTNTNTRTSTRTRTNTNTRTSTRTRTNTNTRTSTRTRTNTATTSPHTLTPTATNTLTPTATNTATPTATNTATPTATSTSTNFPSVQSGAQHTCALTSAGTVYCWGYNYYGQLGDGTTTNRRIPVAVSMPEGVTIASISVGGGHTCALTSAGTVYCWGYNYYGQLGDGTTTNRTTPVALSIPGGVSVVSISAGGSHTCAVTSAGAVYCWGYNEYGQLGDGTITNRTTPVAVRMPFGVTSFASIRPGTMHTCALTSAGLAYCWGYNVDGELGDGTNTNRRTPVGVSMPFGVSFASIRPGMMHTCALTSAGAAYCWGWNAYGQLGDDTKTNRRIPVAVNMPGGVTSFASISVDGWHTCVLTSAGVVYCWGWNAYGQRGDGTNTDSTIGIAVNTPGGAISFASMSAGLYHTCAVTSTGTVYCWGSNQYGQLGAGGIAASNTMIAVVMPNGVPSAFASIHAGGSHTCALTSTGAGYCWGLNIVGELGDDTITNRAIPAAVRMPGGVTSYASISAGLLRTCALTSTGAAYCWGYNGNGQLGDGTTVNSSTPVAVNMPGGVTAFVSISVGGWHTCTVTSVGAVYCWGYNYFGELGDGTTTDRPTPVAVSMPDGVTIASISAGEAHTCALTSVGAVYCWGYNAYGELGDGTTVNSSTPVAVSMPGGVTIASISAGEAHTCALTSAGAMYCWGANGNGQLGDGTTTDRPTPVAVSMPGGATITSISAGAYHTCAVTSAGAGYCWGYNYYGQLGDGTLNEHSITVAVSMPGGETIASISAGGRHTCALTSAGAGYCWGYNEYGQLGDGIGDVNYNYSRLPVPVHMQFTVGGELNRKIWRW